MPPLRVLAALGLLGAIVLLLPSLQVGPAKAAGPAGIDSDDFNTTNLNTAVWTLVDPIGGGSATTTGAGTGNARLSIGVPGGVSHNPFGVNRSVRVMQAANNVNFQIEAKFESSVTQASQIQGLLIQQDTDDWLRFDVYSDGTNMKVFAGSTAAGVTSTKVNAAIPAGAPVWLRITRAGNQWTNSYSLNGTSWTTAVSYSRSLTVTAVGAFGANHGSGSNIPAHTVLVDYFFDTVDPINPEDGSGTPGSGPSGIDSDDFNVASLNTAVWTLVDPVGGGSATTTGAGTGNARLSISVPGGVSHNPFGVNRSVRVMQAANNVNFQVEAKFESAVTQSNQIQGLLIQQDADDWLRFDVFSDGSNVRVFAGSTASGVTSAKVNAPIPAGTPVWLRITRAGNQWTNSYSLDGTSWTTAVTYSRTLTVTAVGVFGANHGSGSNIPAHTALVDYFFDLADPVDPEDGGSGPPGGGGIESDDFNNPNLQLTEWALVDPLGGGTVSIDGAGTGNARLAIGVPGGFSHDPYGVNRSVRVMQDAENVDFQIETKLESAVTQINQIQGLLIEQDADDWLRFDVYSTGSGVKVFAGSTVAGVTSAKVNVTVASGTPVWLRVTRQGNQWTNSYSFNGTTWTTAVTYSRALTVTAVGVMAGNHGTGGNIPSHVGLFDYFFNTAAPVSPEDGGTVSDTLPPLLHAVLTVPSTNVIQIEWATDEAASGVVQYGLTSQYELGSVSQSSPSKLHALSLTNLSNNQTYHLRIRSSDGGGRQSLSANIQVTTSATTGAPVINVWYGPEQTFGQQGRAQAKVNVLGTVTDPDGVAWLTYSLNGGPQTPLSRGPTDRRLAGPGDFNADIAYASLSPGPNSVVLKSADTQGHVSLVSVTVNYAAGPPPALPYLVDWSSVSNLMDIAQIIDGPWQLTAAGPHPTVREYDRLLAIGDISWQDYEVTVPVTVVSVDKAGGYPFPSVGPVVGLGLRWQGHTMMDSIQPEWGYWPVGAYAWYRWHPSGIERYEFRAQNVPDHNLAGQIQLGVTYLFKMKVETQPNGHGLYSFKSWQQGTAEPATWMFQYAGVSDLPTGSVVLIAHHVDAVFGDVSVNSNVPH